MILSNKIIQRIILLWLLGVLFLFIRAAFVQKREYNERYFGIVVKKKKASRGQLLVTYVNTKLQTGNFALGPGPGKNVIEQKIEIGDSIIKPSGAYLVYIYKKQSGTFVLNDSVEIFHYSL